MADRGDTHYSVSALNKWFLFSSVVILVSTVWMMIDDWERPWKAYQREFRAIELAKVRAEEETLTAAGALAREQELAAQVASAQATVATRTAELAVKTEALRLARGELWNAIETAKKRKSEFNWERYVVEEERLHRGDPSYGVESLTAIEKAMNDAMGEQEALEAQKQAAEDVVNDLKRELATAEKSFSAGTRDLDAVRKRIAQLDPAAMKAPERLADVIRDAPGLDFVKPNLKVNKVMLENLTFELNFTKKKRIDMCHTCHLAGDRAGFEGDPQPFTSHPRLDLYLSSKSPHPLKDFGCTICHRGAGEALDFVRADHRAADKAQAADWFEKYHWHKQHHWDYPMLAKDFTEASCVQCHKSSMELIAGDAPEVSEGYRLVERFACYACHKIDWFPTKRRTGPSLVDMRSKLTPEFVSSWITDPKGFRPTTWMPQFFHLENYAPGQVVVKSRYGHGRDIEGREWDDAAVSAITAFLVDRAPAQEQSAIPVQGDAHRGRETMRLSGCFACHNMAPFGEGATLAADPALTAGEHNTHGPNLRGVATKVTPEWLFRWIKDPSSYWSDTRMPNLRLSDQEAADIVAYMMEDPDGYFRDVPKGWEQKLVSMPEEQMREVLGEQARWFFARDGRAAVESRLAGEWADLAKLKVAVGEKLVANYGCFSCHEIAGMTEMMPIGTELSNWGSKTVDKLAFNFAAQEFGLDPNYREGWLMQKLHAPRSFDTKKVLNPTERLRMPYFGFSDEQVHAIATFVVGLVDDEVQRAKMVPTAEKAAMDAGLRAVRQKNCYACHMVEPGTVTYLDEGGVSRTIAAEPMPVSDEQKIPPAHDLAAVKSAAEKFEVDEVTFRVLRAEPDIGKGVGEKVFVPLDKLVAMGAPLGGEFVRTVTDYYVYGLELHDTSKEGDEAFSVVSGGTGDEFGVFDVDQKLRDYSAESYDKLRWTFAPPVLWDEGGKLQKEWFFDFLNDVVPLRPQVRVRMPSFTYAPGEAEAIAHSFALKSAREWPARFTRALRLSRKLPASELGAACGVDARTVAEIEAGAQMATRANFPKVLAYAQKSGFTAPPAVNPAFETQPVRSTAYLNERRAAEPNHFALGEAVGVKGVNCFQCHFRLGQPPPADPLAWAPDLNIARDRLRQDWVLNWLADPGKVYPGTSMPANFTADPPQYQEHYPNSTNEAQMRVVLEWLYNFDRLYMTSQN